MARELDPRIIDEMGATGRRILDGALRAIARHGVRKLSMSDICEQAGVSRGTLYRYFKNKQDVLELVSDHVKSGFETALREAVRANPSLEHRVRVVLDVIVHYGDTHPEAVLVIDEEPAFAIGFLRREFSSYVDTVLEALDPVLEQAPVVREGKISKSQLAEILLRVGISNILLPSVQSGKIPQRLATLWEALSGKPS